MKITQKKHAYVQSIFVNTRDALILRKLEKNTQKLEKPLMAFFLSIKNRYLLYIAMNCTWQHVLGIVYISDW